MCPAVAARPKAEGTAEKKSQNSQIIHKQCGGNTRCALPAESYSFGGYLIPRRGTVHSRMRGATQVQWPNPSRGSRHCTTVETSDDGGRSAMCAQPLPQMGEMGHTRSFTLGVKDDFEGIQAAVRRCSPTIRRHNTFPGSGRVSSRFTGGNPLAVKQKSYMCCSSHTKSERVLLQVLSGPQTRGGGFALSWIYRL